jgi:integrase
MARRRRFGRLRQLPSGRWQARYTGPDGRERSAPDTFTTKTAADRWLSAVETDLSRTQWIDPGRGQVPLSTYAREWLTGRADIKIRTAELYDWLLEKYLLPELGKTPIAKITPSMVRTWHTRLLVTAPPTPTRQSYSLLRAMLNTAVRDEILVRNPCVVRGAGVSRSAERTTASVPQVAALAEAVPARYRALILLAAWSGARWGELVALTRDRLDLDAGTMTIDRQLVELRNGSLRPETPKSAAGRRTIHVPPHLLPELRTHLAAFVPAECDYVFPSPKGEPLRHSSFRTAWQQARDSVGLPELRFHDLRHTGNTLAAATGASTKELMARMGHASMGAALIYQHATADRDAAIARALSDLAGRVQAEPGEAALRGTGRARPRATGT